MSRIAKKCPRSYTIIVKIKEVLYILFKPQYKIYR